MRPARLVLVAVLGCRSLASQQPPEAVSTLHVYSNLVQVPVLVLGAQGQSLPPIPPQRFTVSIDSGRPKPPVHVRLEGDDVIALSILVDLSGDQDNLVPRLAEAVANLAPAELSSRDRVSLYALDCQLVRAADDIPADASVLRQAMTTLVQSHLVHGEGKTRPSCGRSLRLRAALGSVFAQMSGRSGRRVLLAITDGHDKASSTTWRTITAYANQTGVALFGMADQPFAAFSTHRPASSYDDDFQEAAELSGGMMLPTVPRSVAADLRHFLQLVRGRYIVEFPRPNALSEGLHRIDVAVGRSDVFIRSAGVSMPAADPHLLADPSTVPTDNSTAPEPGTRKPLPR